jgi:hypothetical protein
MIPEVLVNVGLRAARRDARACAKRAESRGCVMVAVVAELDGARACSSMAVSPGLETRPEQEIALMKCALARVCSLLVLHLGQREAFEAAFDAVHKGAELARLATEGANDAAG